MKGVSEELVRHQINTLVQTKWVVFHTAPRWYRGGAKTTYSKRLQHKWVLFLINFLRKTSFQQKYDTTKTFFNEMWFHFFALVILTLKRQLKQKHKYRRNKVGVAFKDMFSHVATKK